MALKQSAKLLKVFAKLFSDAVFLTFSTEAGVPPLTEGYLSPLSSFCQQFEYGLARALLCPSAHPPSNLDGLSAAVPVTGCQRILGILVRDDTGDGPVKQDLAPLV